MPLASNRQISRLALPLLAGLAWAGSASHAQAQTDILFVGNSYTHTRYSPTLNYLAGDASDPSNAVVHDLLCPGTTTGACSSGVEQVASPQSPTSASLTGPAGSSNLQTQLNYLNTTGTASQYTEVGPFSGVAGIFLKLTQEAGLNYNVSLISVSSATLTGYANNTGNEAGDLALIENSKYSQVVLQDQSFQPLPSTITIAGPGVTTHTQITRGNAASFQSGVNGLINDINTAHGGSNSTQITLYETPPIAAYGYTSSNPNAPIFGSSTIAGYAAAHPTATTATDNSYAPYIGDANPIASMASDLHNAYTSEAASAHTTYGNSVRVALAGDAWVTAIGAGYAQQDPFLVNEPAGQVDLWDSDALLACCETPIGYHPSADGDYIDAMSLFYTITGINPLTDAGIEAAEFNPDSGTFSGGASDALLSSTDVGGSTDTITADQTAELAYELADSAVITEQEGGPVPEPASMAVLAVGLAGIGAVRRRRRR